MSHGIPQPGPAGHPVPAVPAVQVTDLPAEVPGTLLDVREDDEWAAGHATGALHIPLGQLPVRLGELDLDEPVHVVCRSGGRSARAVEWLNENGAEAVNVAGGMGAWAEAGRPMEGDGPGEPFVR